MKAAVQCELVGLHPLMVKESPISSTSRRAANDQLARVPLHWDPPLNPPLGSICCYPLCCLLVINFSDLYTADIAVDWVTNKLYWVNGTDSTINIFDLTSGSHATVLTVDGTVTDIALHPGNRYNNHVTCVYSVVKTHEVITDR